MTLPMQRMLLRRSKWRQHGEVLFLARSASGSSANEDLSLTELAEQRKPTFSNTETLFGIAPRKVADEEDEDFVPTMPTGPPSTVNPSKPQNYFSKTWAMQKSIIMGATNFQEKELSPPSQPVRSQQLISTGKSSLNLNRIWQAAPDSQACTRGTFKFVSLKVLSTEVAEKHKGQLYRHVPLSVFDWKSRRRKLLADLDRLSAEIVCLQELDKFDDLQSDLSGKGYAGLYKASSRQSSSGCAIFWKQRRFELLHEESIDFNLLNLRPNVAQFCVLQSIVSGTTDEGSSSNSENHDDHIHKNCLIVGNMESLYNPRRGDIKLGQCRVFLEQAHTLSSRWPGAPLVIGGCFHATPESLIYKFLAESKVDLFGLDYRTLSGHFPAKPAKSLGSATTSLRAKEAKTNVDLTKRLSDSLLGTTRSKMNTNATNLVYSASLSSCQSPMDKGNVGAKAFVSKTIDFLEGSIQSTATSKEVVVENVGGVDGVTSGTSVSSESNRDSIKNSRASESGEPSGRTAEPASNVSVASRHQLPGGDAPEHDCLVAVDKEVSSVVGAMCGRATCPLPKPTRMPIPLSTP